MGPLDQQRHPQRQHADDAQLAHAERQRIDRRVAHGALGQQQIDSVAHRDDQADEVARGGAQPVVQRHERKTRRADREREQEPAPRLFMAEEKVEEKTEEKPEEKKEEKAGGRRKRAARKAAMRKASHNKK